MGGWGGRDFFLDVTTPSLQTSHWVSLVRCDPLALGVETNVRPKSEWVRVLVEYRIISTEVYQQNGEFQRICQNHLYIQRCKT